MKWAPVWLSVLLIFTACAPGTPPAPTPTPPPTTPEPTPTEVVAPVQVVQAQAPPLVRPIASPSPRALPLSVLVGRSGGDLRAGLDLALQENAFLVAAAMDAAANARLDDLIGVSSAVDDNSLELAEIVGAVRGPAAAQAFIDDWRGAMADLIAGSNPEQHRARLVSDLAEGDFSTSVADDLLARRFQAQLARAAPDLIAGSSDELGHPWAAALVANLPSIAQPATEGQDIELRVRLDGAVDQRVYLTGLALAAGADVRTAQMQAHADAAVRQAQAVGSELTSVYGGDVGNAVADRLTRETIAAVSDDRGQASAEIDQLRREIDATLSAANPLLPPGLLVQQLRASDQPLLTALDAFATRDFRSAYARLREAARQSQKPADSIALAIVDRYPGRYLVLPTPEPDE